MIVSIGFQKLSTSKLSSSLRKKNCTSRFRSSNFGVGEEAIPHTVEYVCDFVSCIVYNVTLSQGSNGTAHGTARFASFASLKK